MSRRHSTGKKREILYGVNPVLEALRARKRSFYKITVKRGAKPGGSMGKIASLAESANIPMELADLRTIETLAGSEGHQGVVASVSPPSYVTLDRLLETASPEHAPTIVVLDGIMDPRNLGAIIRSAEAFGLDGVVFPERRSASYTPAAAKASAGAGEFINLCQVVNVAETIRLLKKEGFECVAFDSAAREAFANAAPGPLALVMGGEGTGVRPLVAKRCGRLARIPMKGKVGSLNVSAAAALVFYISSLRPRA